jgi:hypothetical protein
MDWITHLVTFLVGLGAGWTLRIGISNRSSSKSRISKVSQSGNTVHGDMVAGDLDKSKRG